MQLIFGKLKKNWAIITICLLAAILRFCAVTYSPQSLNWDEVSHGYNAYSILNTGRDEWGNILPMIFRAYGDYKLPVYIYTTVVSVALFGLNEFALRLPSALAGVGTVIFTYLLVKEFFGFKLRVARLKKITPNTQAELTAILCAFLVAVEPWSLFLSHAAFEANLALMLFTGGVYFFLKGNLKPKYYLPAAVFLGLTVWTYNSYRIFTPLMLVVLIFLYRISLKNAWEKKRRLVVYSVLLILFAMLPMLFQLAVSTGQARYVKVAIIDEGAIAKINEQRALSKRHPTVERLINNKGTYFFRTAGSNWFKHYSPRFLFLEGGSQYQYSMQGMGLIYLINLPFLVTGLLVLGKDAIKRKHARLLLAWFIISPIPASITRDSPHALRTITMLPVPMILSVYGLIAFFARFAGKYARFALFAYIGLVLIFLTKFILIYFNEYKINYSWSWQYGYKEAVAFTKENYNKYDKIIVTKKYGEPHIFYLFYWPWNPQDYMNDENLVRFEQSDWYWVDRFDKFYFVNDWDIPTRSDKDFVLESGEEFDCRFSSCLLITSPGTHQQDWDMLTTIRFLDGSVAFEIFDNKFD